MAVDLQFHFVHRISDKEKLVLEERPNGFEISYLTLEQKGDDSGLAWFYNESDYANEFEKARAIFSARASGNPRRAIRFRTKKGA